LFQQAKEIDMKAPPANDKSFKPAEDRESRIINQRAALKAKEVNSSGGNTFSLNFQGFDHLLQNQPATPPAVPAPQALATPIYDDTEGPDMTLAQLAHEFNLLWDIEEKLDSLRVSGPHALLFITREQLDDADFKLGQLADVL